MNEYVFLTSEGFTKSPNGEDVENFQILGFEKSDNKENAINLLLKHNVWIIEKNFNIQKIKSRQLLNF